MLFMTLVLDGHDRMTLTAQPIPFKAVQGPLCRRYLTTSDLVVHILLTMRHTIYWCTQPSNFQLGYPVYPMHYKHLFLKSSRDMSTAAQSHEMMASESWVGWIG